MRRLEDIGEFGLIARIERLARGRDNAQVVLGMGDDAALLRPRSGEDLVATTDACIEGVHFRWRTQAPATVGRRALAINLSDLAAMGARPIACLLALAAPGSLSLARVDGILRGLLTEGRRHVCPLVGGNVSRAEQVSLTITALGAVKRGHALQRGAARPGDRLFVTGTLGGAALALARSEREGRRLRVVPVPRLGAGRALARMGARGACIDVSDGLVADLGHLLEESGLGADVDAARLPLPRGFAAACSRLDLDPATVVASGGEDYELLFTLRPTSISATTLERRLGVRVSEIGRIAKQRGIRGLSTARGWRHF